MYRNSSDVATHEEPWATVFRRGLREACEHAIGLYSDVTEADEFGVPVYDRLTRQQKVAMLATVGKALLDPSEPAPELTAVVEGTVAVLLEIFRRETVVEGDGTFDDVEDPTLPCYTECRRAALAIYGNGWNEEELGPLPNLEESSGREWEELLEDLEDHILFDEDYLDEDLVMDDSPMVSGIVKQSAGIPDEYFVSTAPEPTRAALIEHLATLSRLTGMNWTIEDASDEPDS